VRSVEAPSRVFAEHRVSYEDAVSASGVTTASARSQLGGLTKLIARRLPDHLNAEGDTDWPFECESTPDRQLRFRLSEDAASGWMKAESD
jgi:hypothetical protein